MQDAFEKLILRLNFRIEWPFQVSILIMSSRYKFKI